GENRLGALDRSKVLDHRHQQRCLSLLAIRIKMLAEQVRPTESDPAGACGWPAAIVAHGRQLLGALNHRNDDPTDARVEGLLAVLGLSAGHTRERQSATQFERAAQIRDLMQSDR